MKRRAQRSKRARDTSKESLFASKGETRWIGHPSTLSSCKNRKYRKGGWMSLFDIKLRKEFKRGTKNKIDKRTCRRS